MKGDSAKVITAEPITIELLKRVNGMSGMLYKEVKIPCKCCISSTMLPTAWKAGSNKKAINLKKNAVTKAAPI